jgi:predicted nuclease of predicted toxin-antitoxin system
VSLLLDNNLSPQLAGPLSEHGHDVDHVRDHDLQAAADDVVMQLAADQHRILVSADTDFGRLLQLSQAPGPSVVLLRAAGSRRPAAQAKLLLDNLPAVEADLLRGALVVLEDTRVRIRDLPLIS